MRIAVLNFSGNVGKTTIARQCLSPRMNNCPVLFVETINEGGDETNIKGRDFREVLIEMAVLEQVVVDIGSSNIEQVFAQLKSMVGAHEDFDFYVVPTVPSQKQQKDTAKIFLELIELGIDPSKIKVIFNQVDVDADIQKEFSTLINTLSDFPLNLKAVIHSSEVFPLIGNMSIEEAISEGVDFKAAIAATADLDEKRNLAKAQGISRLSKRAKMELDSAFEAMFKE